MKQKIFIGSNQEKTGLEMNVGIGETAVVMQCDICYEKVMKMLNRDRAARQKPG